jgi:hypothetical protein
MSRKMSSRPVISRGMRCLLSLGLFPAWSTAQISFTEVAAQAGIDHEFVVYEGMFGGGACVFDLNNDGLEDLYLTGGMNDDALYLNMGDGVFRNIFQGSGLEITTKYVTQGVVGADVNRDGWVDLFITTITTKDSVKTIPRARNLLFLNNGDHTFRDATAEYKLDRLYSFSTGACFGDFNADGYPDLYVGNYFLEYDGELSEIKDATIVNASKTAKGYLLLNHKGKYFKDVYAKYGLHHRGFGFGGVFTDFDNDGHQDLLVYHDFGYKATPNYLLRNNYPKKSFSYVEEALGMDLRINAMAAAAGDYNNDGLLDYFVTNIKFNNFMVNQGPGMPFKDMARELGMAIFTISWGANFADFDHDGYLDLFVANGDLNPNCTPMGNFLFRNERGTFVEMGRAAGVNDYGVGRGSVVFDMDNDGDLDILVINQRPVKDYPVASKTRLYRNDSARGNWLKVALLGVQAEPRGIGSRVELVVGQKRMIREIDGGGASHLSQSSTIAHFGLSDAAMVDSVIVTWAGGKRQILLEQIANQLLRVREETRVEPSKARYLGMSLLALMALALCLFLYRRMPGRPS